MGSYPKTAFQKIALFNTLIGNSNAASPAGLAAQLHCVREEFEELCAGLVAYCHAVERCDLHGNDGGDVADAQAAFEEMRDGIADVLVTVYGLAHRAGIDADRDLEIVNISNMSKFIKRDFIKESEDDIMQRLAFEQLNIANTKGLATSVQETTQNIFAITSAKDQTGKDGKFYPAGKLLKPSTYKEPDWSANLVCQTPAQGYFIADAGSLKIAEGLITTGRVATGFNLGVTFDEAKAASMEDVCDKAPEGWVCTRADGHEGACAAVEVDPAESNVNVLHHSV